MSSVFCATVGRRLTALRTHGDLLWLQLVNWLSGQMLFAVLGICAPRTTLAHAAFLETVSAFYGTTFATIAFRIGFDSIPAMRMLVVARFAILFVMSGAAIHGWMDWMWVIGIAPSLLTPAHFPIAHGARRAGAVLLVAFRAMACIAFASLRLSPFGTFAVYFAPGVAYAIALHIIHFDDWARSRTDIAKSTAHIPARASPNSRSPVDAFLLLPWASAGLFFMQASMVSAIAAASPLLAIVERLLRSMYSMVYPYLMRSSRFDAPLTRYVVSFALAAPAASVAAGMTAHWIWWMWVPTLTDLTVTNLFRLTRVRLFIIATWVTLGVLALAKNQGIV